MGVHNSPICNSPKLETRQIPLSRSMGTESVLHPQQEQRNGLLTQATTWMSLKIILLS